ncbi:glycosyltransferase [Virgibacillus chiguensis]|uniref:Glycosyltransferase involved in cell wall bisynthesis n=1 Tax=Virgibacillus chiguensis TaxID=411959 RepID=A0A1M5QKD4_9BACI|nr:glycosyltransferase [Virgibacillus chiguensis]SHH14552.1 Glycosyltransferase involved in cell wall bisynthesis [Virgibacillus chiguensis]
MKTKVIHLINHLKIGGAETLVTEYALNINKDNFNIIIVTMDKFNNSINEKRLINADIEVINLGEKLLFINDQNKFKYIINKFYKFILFFNLVKKRKPDIIHTHLGLNKYLLPIRNKAKGIKLYYTVHSDVDVLFGQKQFKNRIITKYCIKRKGLIPIALHKKMQNKINKTFNTKNCVIVPNGIDIEKFKTTDKSRKSILHSLNLNEDAFIVGHVGRFVPAKNHKFLINVFKNIKKTVNSSHLILIGVGKLDREIKEQVNKLGLENDVSFLGNRSDIPELMNVMDVFVFPSIHEGFGNVLIEAQAAGVRCVVSNNIPKEAILTNLVKALSLDDPIEEWSREVINSTTSEKIDDNLDKHDINNVVKKLQELYK